MQRLKATTLANAYIANPVLIAGTPQDVASGTRHCNFHSSPYFVISRVQQLQTLVEKKFAEVIRKFFRTRGNNHNPFLTPARLTRIARLGRSSPALERSKQIGDPKLPERNERNNPFECKPVDFGNEVTREMAETGWFPLIKVSATPPACSFEQSPSPGCDGKRDRPCASPGIGGRCVLCVGGRAALYPEYRRLVEASGGKLVFYRNVPQNHGDHLPALLARADMVVCPVDCVNHNAFFTVKRYCRHSGKPCVLLERSNLPTFREGIATLAALSPSLAPDKSTRSMRRLPTSSR